MSVAGPHANTPLSASPVSLDSSSDELPASASALVELDDAEPDEPDPLLVELDDAELDDPELDALVLDPLELD